VKGNKCKHLLFPFKRSSWNGGLGFVRSAKWSYGHQKLTFCFRLLPQPVFAPLISDDEPEHQIQTQSTTTVIVRAVVPAYGQRSGWRPTSTEDFGAYPMLVSFVFSSEPRAIRWWRCIPRMPYCTISFRHGHKESVWYNYRPRELIFILF
jgi:hypothetical protein